MEIIPAVLTDDPRQAREWLEGIKKSGKFSRVQIDFIDGKYADNKTIEPEEVDMTPYLELGFDAHLMVVEKNLEKYVRQAKKVGFDRIIAQMESIGHPGELAGLALDVHTGTDILEPYLPGLEVVVVMAVESGFGGQEFDPKVIKKIRVLSGLRREKNYRYRICVDGGVEQDRLAELEAAGADEVAVGAARVLSWTDAE